jgi:hypothetical protein
MKANKNRDKTNSKKRRGDFFIHSYANKFSN